MDKKIINNLKSSYLYNSKFPIILKSQVIDNLFIQPFQPLLKRQRASFLSFPSTKKVKQKNKKVIIDNMLRLNYLKENDSLVNEYINYLIMKGIIVQQEQSSYDFVFSNKENKFTNNIIEKINNIEILKIKRFFIPQIIAQIYIESDEITQNKIRMNKMEKKESIEMLPLEKKPLKKEIINNIIVNGKIISDYNIETINEIEIVCRKPHIIIIDKGISLKVTAKEKPQLQEISINSIFVHGNKSVNSKYINYIIQRNEEINIHQIKKLVIIKQNMDTLLILGNIKPPNQKCILEELFIQGKTKPNNDIQKTEEFIILQEKDQFFEIDNIINLIITPDEDDEDDINIILNENNIDNISIGNDINTNTENTQTTRLRNKKYLKSIHKRKKKVPLYEMESMERLFFERVYDMLLIERSWETLDIEENNNFFIGALYNNSNYNNINTNIFGNENNNLNEINNINNLNNTLNNDVKINKSFEIICEKENEENPPENFAQINKNWNEVICPKFNSDLKILGKKNKLNNKKQKPSINQNQNQVLNEISFNIPRKEQQHFLDKLKNTIKNIDNNNSNTSSNLRKWNDNNIIKEKVKNFTIIKKKLKNKKDWDNPNKIQKEISLKIRSEKYNINLINQKTEPKIYLENDNKLRSKNHIHKFNNKNDNEDNIYGKKEVDININPHNPHNSINKAEVIINNSINNSINKNNKLNIEEHKLFSDNNIIENNSHNNKNIQSILNNNNNINDINDINDIVNQENLNFQIPKNENNKNDINLGLKKSHTNPFNRNHNNILGNEEEQFIDLYDYDYNSNKKEIFQDGKKRIKNKRENKRYSEDREENKENEFILSRRNTDSYRNYNTLFKSKSNEKNSVETMRRQMSKRSSQKDFELLRENSFDHNNYD